ncbi:MAG: eukaryotic-like serine/threonine-protein kinase [Pseudonocardiales bacterium]|jgi:serine/threonine-protein kinase|nr:eukaryotic-like serine/threonine-protein kinase [Pseudonocardiales bacterium]
MASFGAYEVIQQVAVGSTGTVYRARHREINRIAAIKELSPEVRAVPGLVERFRAEAHTLAALDSPHVVSVFDFVEEPQRVWIAEEWVDGLTIETLLRSTGSLTPEQAVGVLRGALLGLAHAHDRQIVHRDIAPSNIIADLAGTSMLIDFGLAAPIGQTGRCGTPAFMSPEAVAGAPVGKSSDVYSAAAVLYTLLVGRTPFPARTAEDVLQAQVQQPPPPLTGHGPAMAALVTDAMAKDPAARPPDAGAFLARLEDAAQQRYGAGWLERSSIAGLVGAATAGVAAVTAATAGGAAASSGGAASGGAAAAEAGAAATTTSFLETAATTGAVRTSRFSRSFLVGAAVVTVAAIGAVTALALTNGDKKSPQKSTAAQAGGVPAGVPASVTPSATEIATLTPAQTLAASVPNGRYRIKSVIVASNVPSNPVGTKSTVTWTITLTCAATSCTGKIHSSSGRVFTATYDGTVLVAKEREVQGGPCIYRTGPRKGQVDRSTHYSVTTTEAFTLTVTASAPGTPPAPGVPTAMAGGGKIAISKPIIRGVCTPDPPGKETLRSTATRLP